MSLSTSNWAILTGIFDAGFVINLTSAVRDVTADMVPMMLLSPRTNCPFSRASSVPRLMMNELSFFQGVVGAAVDDQLVVLAVDRGCNDISKDEICAFEGASIVDSRQLFDFFSFLGQFLCDVCQIILEPVVFSSGHCTRERLV
jgi:hypothetical protein